MFSSSGTLGCRCRQSYISSGRFFLLHLPLFEIRAIIYNHWISYTQTLSLTFSLSFSLPVCPASPPRRGHAHCRRAAAFPGELRRSLYAGPRRRRRPSSARPLSPPAFPGALRRHPDVGTCLRWPSPARPPSAVFPCAPCCRAATALPRSTPASPPVAPPPRGLSARRLGQLHVTASHAAGWLPLPPVPSTGAGEDA